MDVGRTTKTAVAGAAVAVMATGAVLAGAGTAAAADRYSGPELSVDQGDIDGKNVKLNLTNPNRVNGLLDVSTCTSALLNGQQALAAFIAYNTRDYAGLVRIMLEPGLTAGPSATNSVLEPGPNGASRTVDVADGVYAYLGTCGGTDTVLDPDNIGVSFLPVIVPDGIGSIAPVLDFGGTALGAGIGSADLLPLLTG
ncbi:hypothetical protein ACFWPA_13430 [Rhodococcus sp. NPDC058505]|uniref:hypothetical protein n=1 Tax=unclassified Rhodococcus (in: high G+C Gram-positive bacteria) TaxID=192944 RepID=UPI0036688857